MGRKRVKGSTGRAKAKKRVTEPPDPDAPKYRYLVWRFGRLDHQTEFSCQGLLPEDARELEAELEAFQKKPIYNLRRKSWLKFVPASDMTTKGREALAAVSEQEDGLWQLHLGRYKWRVWGYYEEPEFFFLFWDADHLIATGKSRHRKT